MQVFTLETEAGEVSAELARRGLGTRAKVRVEVTVLQDEMAALAQHGGAFDWLEAEPDLYSDADLIKPD